MRKQLLIVTLTLSLSPVLLALATIEMEPMSILFTLLGPFASMVARLNYPCKDLLAFTIIIELLFLCAEVIAKRNIGKIIIASFMVFFWELCGFCFLLLAIYENR